MLEELSFTFIMILSWLVAYLSWKVDKLEKELKILKDTVNCMLLERRKHTSTHG